MGARLGVAFALAIALGACDSFEDPPADEQQLPTPSLPDAGRADAALPTMECVEPPSGTLVVAAFDLEGCLHSVDGRMLAMFTWSNGLGEELSVAYGADNHVAPGDAGQGQPEFFGIGRGGRFGVAIGDEPVTWRLLDEELTISSSTADCGESCSYSQLAGPDSYEVDICTDACGDGTCTKGETCHSCGADCDCTGLEPLLDCVVDHGDGRFTASFGFRNDSERAGGIALGLDNHFSSGEPTRGQPWFFPPGESHDLFQVTSTETELTWALGALSVSATSESAACPTTCDACSEYATCVGDSCRESCGDGWCTLSEGCDVCPADCACGPGEICEGGACGTPPRCGIELHCGVEDSLGVRVDCGECPDGETCVIGVCKPICGEDEG